MHISPDLIYIFLLHRSYLADIKTEPEEPDHGYNQEELPHTYSMPFNPYRQSRYNTRNVAAAAFCRLEHDCVIATKKTICV